MARGGEGWTEGLPLESGEVVPFPEGLTYFGQHFSQPAGSQGPGCEIRAGFLRDIWSLGEGQHVE